jgi:hypothetical protein
MIDRGPMIEDPATPPEEPPRGLPKRTSESLEQRVDRLEDAVAALQDTHLMEERIMDRVVHRLNRDHAGDSIGIVDAERRTSPPPRESEESSPEAPPRPVPSVAAKPAWLFVETLAELRAMVAMFFDTRFRVGWGAYFSVLVLAFVLVSSWLLPFSHLPVVGGPLDKAVGLILALFAYKRLHREVTRYREVVGRPAPAPHRY